MVHVNTHQLALATFACGYLFAAFVVRMAFAYIDGRVGDAGRSHRIIGHVAAVIWPLMLFSLFGKSAWLAFRVGTTHREAQR